MSRFHVVALALMFAVTVAGCGGGSSTSTADMDGDGMTTTEPDPEPTPADQLVAANMALETAETAVAALTSSSTSEEAAAAYGAMAEARTAVHAASNLPDNVIADLQSRLTTTGDNLDNANTLAMQFRAVVSAVSAAQGAIDALTGESTDADVATANGMVTAARTALTNGDMLDADDTASLGGLIANVETQITAIHTARADRPTEQDIADAVAVTKAAGTKAVAIANYADSGADRGSTQISVSLVLRLIRTPSNVTATARR